ncbi:HWE histidine kinase domain-containing protein [Acetobacter estunensis]|uniref:HWE histidine kinase domain-containing protein n=1 Tax=Acetobacter estunensis TaxID=104097 RepID=UPI001C2DA618|nr:HWE histidine kinase domain-containing protein [Acetobacter estunensis]MBV1836605.1 GAF domain-containing protein [Acetobacter estunensis]
MTDTQVDPVIFGQADLTTCDREPIHIPSCLQPGGCMLAFSVGKHQLVRYSVNAETDMGCLRLYLGMSLEECVGSDVAATILALSNREAFGHPAIRFDVVFPGGLRRDMVVHRSGQDIVVECEPVSADPLTVLHLLTRLRTAVERLRNHSDILALLRVAASELSRAFGYDRVMIYRFAPDWSGEVVVEERAIELESFLGQHFPSSDIPAQARELYRRSLIRVIGDVAYEPIPLVEEDGRAPLDMSFMHLRAVSPIHCEYLTNMGVRASMSISLIVDGKLWGLIACHHYSPKRLSMGERIAAKMLGEIASLQIVALVRARRLALRAKADTFLSQFLHDAKGVSDIASYVHRHLAALLHLIPCNGGGVWTEGRWTTSGLAVSEDVAGRILASARQQGHHQIWACDHLSAASPDLERQVGEVAGALVIPILPDAQAYLILFRQEAIRTVVWGGDPEKTYTTGPSGMRLTPRRSFEIWKEEVRKRSVAWSEDDLELASELRTALMELMAVSHQQKLRERARGEAMQRMISSELDHRVKNILSVVQSLVSHVVASGSCTMEDVVQLQGRLRSLAEAHDQMMNPEQNTDLREILTIELAPYVGESDRMQLDGPDLPLTDRATTFLTLLLHELVTNAAKYGALSVPDGRVAVTWTHDAEKREWSILWQESGGPPVQEPARSGFGTLLMNRAIAHDLGGRTARRFEPEGLIVEVHLPANVAAAVPIAPPEKGDAPSRADVGEKRTPEIVLSGKRVLVVEDEFLVAMEVEETLEVCQVAAVRAVSSIREALDTIGTDPLDVALLDVNVRGQSSLPVAHALEKTGVPFAFATGYGGAASVLSEFGPIPVLRKPYDMTQVVEMLAELLE